LKAGGGEGGAGKPGGGAKYHLTWACAGKILAADSGGHLLRKSTDPTGVARKMSAPHWVPTLRVKLASSTKAVEAGPRARAPPETAWLR
jgi:hypothetical protein